MREAKNPGDVNAWVKSVTQGLIPELLAPDTPFDVILANALYFKGGPRLLDCPPMPLLCVHPSLLP